MEAIDLGLSVKWASCNIGTNSPEEYGNYYAWGEIVPKNIYEWDTYKWCDNSNSFTIIKYCTKRVYGSIDNKIILDPEDDVAIVNTNDVWRIPTYNEWIELIDNCTWKWTKNYNNTGIKGRIVTGTNSNSIFLPEAGYRYYNSLDFISYGGYYWSNSLGTGSPDGAWYVEFNACNIYKHLTYRYRGLSIRPVIK